MSRPTLPHGSDEPEVYYYDVPYLPRLALNVKLDVLSTVTQANEVEQHVLLTEPETVLLKLLLEKRHCPYGDAMQAVQRDRGTVSEMVTGLNTKLEPLGLVILMLSIIEYLLIDSRRNQRMI